QNRAAELGRAGERCALNLTGPRLSKEAIRRGDWVVSPELHAPTDRPDVRLTLLASESQSLKHWSPVHVHIGSAHVMRRIALLESSRRARREPSRRWVGRGGRGARLPGAPTPPRDPWARRRRAAGAVTVRCGPPPNRRSARRLAELAALSQPDADVLPKLL